MDRKESAQHCCRGNMVLEIGKCGTAKTGACFVTGLKEDRILAQALAYGKVLPGMPCYFPLTYIIFCYALPSLLRTKCCSNALRALSLSMTFFYDFKEVFLGPSLLSILHIDLRVTSSHCHCTQTSQLSKLPHRTQSIPNSETRCLLCPPPILPPPST